MFKSIAKAYVSFLKNVKFSEDSPDCYLSIAKANVSFLKNVKFSEDSPDCYRPAFICDGSVDCVDTGKDELDCDTRKILKFEISGLNPGTLCVIC